MKFYVAAGLGVLALAALWGVDRYGYARGVATERAAWQARESTELAAANNTIDRLQREARTTEQQHARDIVDVSARYQRELANAKAKRVADLAAIERGDIRLRDPAAPGESPGCGDGAATATGAGRRDGGTPGELSPAATRFLFELTGDADDVAHQLAACQAIVRRDREPAHD